MITLKEIHLRRCTINVSQGIHGWLEYHKLHSKKTLKNYQSTLSRLTTQFVEIDLNHLTLGAILLFLTQINEDTKAIF